MYLKDDLNPNRGVKSGGENRRILVAHNIIFHVSGIFEKDRLYALITR